MMTINPITIFKQPNFNMTSDSPLQMAMALNFHLENEGFQFISDPENFKQTYKKKIHEQQNSFEILSEIFDVFDVEEVRPPYIFNQTLIFYALKKIPYRVVCSLPLSKLPLEIRYEMLERC